MGNWISPSTPQSQGRAPRRRASQKSQVPWLTRMGTIKSHTQSGTSLTLLTAPPAFRCLALVG